MGVGFSVPQFGRVVEAGRGRLGEVVSGFSARVEAAGADSLWVGDRLLVPVEPSVGYAGRDTIPAMFRTTVDPLVVLTVAATATTRVRLGTNVLNLPWYNPALLGRALASLDVVSGGRVVPGFGTGWSPEEYAAAGVPWDGRGARVDSALDALERWWSDDVVEHDGPAWSIAPSHVGLKPTRTERVHLGGRADAALRRIGRRGAGWLPAVVAADEPADPAPLRRARDTIAAAAQEAGNSTDIAAVVRVNALPSATVGALAGTIRSLGAAGFPDTFVDPHAVAADVDEFADWALRVLAEL
ncbi:TIGR03619 family F420-dependent LLM class oxidoreductase [Actinokineospora pegani]|uniref:TIGR03619 family F420-dependent LLM class oxidoreductase n=1 Tax=Actinokineospora pegani TaxID=2654637 RepID=UPI0012EA9F2E|nr:TIGR03619 family F420-dependent LLM class oxidoreductase [Actinokineospora pegani]